KTEDTTDIVPEQYTLTDSLDNDSFLGWTLQNDFFLHRELKSLTDGIKILCRTKFLALEPSGAPLGYD
ncbi:MAG: hypothetical protein J4N64_04810, partial [Chloroflexi bacterium]|nr:hypothetical protein [Chloroflexota bacterium]